MRKVTYSMSMSMDGFITGPDGGIDWSVPGDDIYQASIDEAKTLGVQLMGRKLYEVMLYWETAADNPESTKLDLDWIALWNPLPKVVFSRTLNEVQGNARLATRSLGEEIQALKAQDGDTEIAIGGADLAAQAARLGLIDEYRINLFPIVLGGGTPYFAPGLARTNLELLFAQELSGGVMRLCYEVKR
ncbi:dihydrofolate reductase family protein [Glutamicibacter soli]|uniref:dihydrofolate reductase family protein n=1 Tax=Glutamicibacter soli TaxID=453836 RepID=UPI003C72D9B2